MKKEVNIKKSRISFSELLALFLVIFISLAIVGVQLSEKKGENSLKPGLAPENPDFVKSHSNNIFTQAAPSQDSHKTGFVVAPVDLNHLSKISTADASVPAYYGLLDTQSASKASSNQAKLSAPASYDLRTLNRVTSVKDQGSAGVCWAFATYSSLESNLLPGENRDFSENNMKNLLSSSYPEGFDRGANDGGNEFMSTAYLARWSGPVAESNDPYSYSGVSSGNPPLQKHVQDVLFLPDRTGPLDNEGIKSAIQSYGAVFTSMYYDGAYYSSAKYSYYYNGAMSANHAVSIVGWDDNFDKSKFSRVPPGNGAFIIKNSWGTGWGEKGYFYISYYDSKIGKDNTIFTAETTNNYQSIYQYDPLGWVQSVGYSNHIAWCANIFTAKSDETLKAVSFYTTDSNSNYEIYIYSNPGSGPISQAGPAISKSGTSPAAGYHTVPLGPGVALKAGQKFSVVMKLTTPNYNFPIAVEMPFAGWSSKAKAKAGESFVSSNGNDWADVTTFLSNTNVCIEAFTVSSTVSGNTLPVASFSATPTSGNAPLNVAFNDTSVGVLASWKWSFGDGTSSTIRNPVHTYSKAGKYTVSLTVRNAAGSNTATKSSYIAVTALKPPTAAFSASPTSGNAPLNVAFTDTSTGSPAFWTWNFGDGTVSTTKNPVHAYSKAGKYTVSLTVRNAAGSKTATKSSYIAVTALKPPTAAFSASPTSGNAPLNVAFTDTSTGSPASWIWNFGDGTASTTKNPVHTYSKVGKYTVTLTVRNAAGSKTATKSSYIAVTALKPPTVAFSASSISGKAPLTVTFTDKSTGSPTSWSWNFGDKSISTVKNPVYKYNKAGKYTVTLIVKNAAGSNTAKKTNYITVK